MKRYKPIVLVILDGFGVSPDKIGSPWEAAEHPTFSEIEKWYPFTSLQASGIAVGLPWGKEGNSEVGHLTIGAGKIIYNYLPKISSSIEDKTFFKNQTFLRAAEHAKKNGSAFHIMGLFSSGTVHAYEEHFYALLDFAKEQNLQRAYLHLFSDGKDAYQKEGVIYFKNLEDLLAEKYPNIKIASVIGRKYAMDRDQNWDRTKKAYELLTGGKGNAFSSASQYIRQNYEKENYDESMLPGMAEGLGGQIKDNDAVIFFNFREDSPRQLARAFVEDGFTGFERRKLSNLFFATMTEYIKGLPLSPAFKSAQIENPLAKIISESGLKQLHIAETEKYAHITYFLNGGEEEPFKNEERILVHSPHVASYTESPEMSAKEIKEAVISNLNEYDFIAVNFANADMVGHTGNFNSTVKALETIDRCIGEILPRVLKENGVLIITADHGNAEEKLYKLTGEEKSKHSINPVPFYLIGNDFKRRSPATKEEINAQYSDVKGTLSDLAPTILDLFGMKKPASMTGETLL